MKSLIPFILSVVVFFITIISSEIPESQLSALERLKLSLSQDFDFDNLCTYNTGIIQCDPNQNFIISLNLIAPPSQVTLVNNDVFALVNLITLFIGGNIELDNQFWIDINSMNYLSDLGIFQMYSMPIDIGTHFPSSLKIVSFWTVYFEFPETIFTATPNLQQLSIGSQNVQTGWKLIPDTISSPSYLQDFSYASSDQGFILGNNFLNLSSIYVFFRGENELLYNSFDTFPKLSIISLQFNNYMIPSSFPTSLFNIPNLITLRITDQFVLQVTTESQVMNFTKSPNLSNIAFYSTNMIKNLEYPGFITQYQYNSILVIHSSDVDLTLIDIFTNELSIQISDCNVIQVADGDYSKVSTITMINSNFQNTDPLPNSICRIKKSITMVQTNLESIPACFICDFGFSYPNFNQFTDNLALPNYTPVCPGFQFLNSSNDLVSTSGGRTDVFGENLGWLIFDESGNVIQDSSIKIGNEVINIPVPPGTGKNKTFPIRFHAGVDSSSPIINILVNYLPPSIREVVLYSGGMIIIGDDFGNDISLANLYVAGNLLSIQSIDHNSISSLTNNFPVSSRPIFSTLLQVDGQETYFITKPNDIATKLSKPFPKLYYHGGIVELIGTDLSFDLTIMNLTINGIAFTNLTQYSDTSLRFAYNPLPIGVVNLEFNLLDYHLSDFIEVSIEPPCIVVQGHCNGNNPVCDPGFTGPDCSSIPANLTRPSPINLLNPIITQDSDYIIDYNQEISKFKYEIKPLEIREYDGTTDELVDSWKIESYTSLAPGDDPIFLTGNFSGSSQVYILSYWIPNATDIIFQNSITVPVLQSSIRYQVGATSHTFKSIGNYLMFDFNSELEFSNPTLDTCSYYENEILPTLNVQPPFEYMKLKVNNIDLYSRFPKFCSVDNVPTQCSITSKYNPSSTYSKSQATITFQLPYFEQLAITDLDLTVLIDLKSSKDELNPLCLNKSITTTTTSSTTTTTTGGNINDKCPGEPECFGHGTCLNSKCHCDEGWEGTMCDSIQSEIPKPEKPDPTNPTTNVTDDKIGLHISIVSIRELNFKSELIREHFISSNWTVNESSNDNQLTYLYRTNLLNSTDIQVEINYFLKDTEISFANQLATKKKGSIKYSASFTKYPFINSLNKLEIIFRTSVSDTSESSDSCTVKEVEYSDTDTSNIENIYIQLNDKVFKGAFTDMAIVDDKIRNVQNLLVPSNESDSNIQSNLLVGIIVPHYEESLVIDPDFSLLLSYVPSSEKEGSICEKSKSKFSKAQIAGIVVGCVAFVAVVTAILIYAIVFNRKKKLLMKNLQQKVAEINSPK